VLPIGGLKEKALAAQRHGVKRVIAPALNEQDLDEFPDHLRDGVEFVFLGDMGQVLSVALQP
jgi:ATP-dependent Lon protease